MVALSVVIIADITWGSSKICKELDIFSSPFPPRSPRIMLLTVATVRNLVSSDGHPQKQLFKTRCGIYRKDVGRRALYTMFLFMGTSRRSQCLVSVPSRIVLLSTRLILSSRTVICITDRVSLFDVAARKLRAKCMAHLSECIRFHGVHFKPHF